MEAVVGVLMRMAYQESNEETNRCVFKLFFLHPNPAIQVILHGN